MNDKRNDAETRIIMLMELIVVGVLFVIGFVVFGPGLKSLIVAGVCLLLLAYLLARTWQKNGVNRKLDAASAVVRAMCEDITVKINTVGADRGLTQFYNEIENLRANLAEKESARQGMLQVLNTIATSTELEKMLEGILPQVVEATRSICSAFYLINPVTDMLEIKHSIGFSKNLYAEFDVRLNEGFLGQTATTSEIRVLRDVPDDTVYTVRTFLGTLKPRTIMSVPIVNQESLLGVLMLASVYDYTQEHVDSMMLMRYYLGVAVHNGVSFEKNKRLTNELKFQNKLIQDLNADLERKVLDRTMFLNDVIDSIKDYAIYAMDTDGVILAWNTGAENLLEFPASQVVGKHVEHVHPDEPDRAEKVRRRIEYTLRDGRYSESGWRIKQNGETCYYEMTLFARYNQMGEVVGFTNVTRDMTAYMKSSAELAAEKELSAWLLEETSRPFILLDADATVKKANAAAKKAVDVQEARGFYGHCKNEMDVRAAFHAVLETDQPAEVVASLKNGAELRLLVSVVKDGLALMKLLLVEVR